MMFCPECGTKNDLGSKFCGECGSKFELTDEMIQKIAAKPASSKASSENHSIRKEKSKLNKFKVSAGVLVMVVCFLLIGRSILGLNDPTMKLMLGTYNYLNSNKIGAEASLSFSDLPRDYEVLEKIEFNTSFGFSGDRAAAKMALDYDHKTLAEGGLTFLNGILFLDLMDLYDDTMFIEIEGSEEIISGIGELKDYLGDLKIKGVNWKKYAKAFTEEMGGSIYKDGPDVIMILDKKDILDGIQEMLKLAEDDEKLKVGLQKALIKMFKDMEKDDFSLDGFGSEAIETALIFLEDDKLWSDSYDDVFSNRDDLEDELDYMMSDFDLKEDIKLVFSFTGYKLKGIQFSTEIEDITLNFQAKLNKGYYGKSYKTSKAIDLSEMDYDDVEDMYQDVGDALADNITSNKSLVKDVENSDFYDLMLMSTGADDFEDFIEIMTYELLYNMY